jgi:uncharacterized protein (DUF2164 family)
MKLYAFLSIELDVGYGHDTPIFEIIGNIDFLDRSIISYGELKKALHEFDSKGLLYFEGDNVKLTPTGRNIKEKLDQHELRSHTQSNLFVELLNAEKVRKKGFKLGFWEYQKALKKYHEVFETRMKDITNQIEQIELNRI